GEHQRSHPLGMCRSKPHGDASARRGSDHMRRLDGKGVEKMAKIADCGARIRICSALRPVNPATGIGNDPIARRGKDWLLVRPDRAALRQGMTEHDRFATPSGIPVPKPRTWGVRQAFADRRLFGQAEHHRALSPLTGRVRYPCISTMSKTTRLA